MVDLPADVLAGDYKLTIKQGKKHDTYDLTIGAVGPVGPAGEDGVDGIDGINGTNGATGAKGEDGANGIDGADGIDGVNGADGSASGTFSYTIDALTCIEQSGISSGDVNQCNIGGAIRTDATDVLPCALRGTATLTTYLCDLNLPDGSLLNEIIAYGRDSSSDGYMEAAVYQSFINVTAILFISPTFGGEFQNTGITEQSFLASFPIYLSSDAPHRVNGQHKYTIAMGLHAPTGIIYGLGFKVTYTVE